MISTGSKGKTHESLVTEKAGRVVANVPGALALSREKSGLQDNCPYCDSTQVVNIPHLDVNGNLDGDGTQKYKCYKCWRAWIV